VALTDSEAKTVCAELSAVAILDTAFGVLGAAFSSFSHKGRREKRVNEKRRTRRRLVRHRAQLSADCFGFVVG